jgi:hypothetical protein
VGIFEGRRVEEKNTLHKTLSSCIVIFIEMIVPDSKAGKQRFLIK